MAYDDSVSVGDKILQGMEEFSAALKSGKPVTEQMTCRKFELHLNPQPYDSEAVKATRGMLNMSQSLFASFLGVSASCVQKWERGESDPPKLACRFMDEIRFNPQYWRMRLAKSVSSKETIA